MKCNKNLLEILSQRILRFGIISKSKVSLSQHVPVARDDVVGGDVDADGEDGDADADPQNDHDHDERLVRGARIWRSGQKRAISFKLLLVGLSKTNCPTVRRRNSRKQVNN